MKKQIRKILVLLFSLFYTYSAGQNVQPSMMVLPYTKSGESALNLYEEVSEYRALILGIEKAFLDQEAELIDLERTILNAREQMRREAGKYKDINDAINQNSPAEITIEAEIDWQDKGDRIIFGILLKAVETSTGSVIYTGTYTSPPPVSRDKNFMKIATNILTWDQGGGVYIDVFLNGMQAGFTKMVNEGKPIKLIITTDDQSDFRLNDEANDDFDLISDLIKKWVKENSMNNISRIKSSTDNRLEFDLIKIPVRTEADGMPYSTDDFATEMRKQLLKICQKASNTMGDGSRVDGGSTQAEVIKGTIMLTMPSLR